jgi:hypothetical protein
VLLCFWAMFSIDSFALGALHSVRCVKLGFELGYKSALDLKRPSKKKLYRDLGEWI